MLNMFEEAHWQPSHLASSQFFLSAATQNEMFSNFP